MRATSVAAILVAAVLGVVPLASGADADPTLATVGGRAIKQSEVEDKVRPKLVEIDSERYEAMKEGLDELIAEEMMSQEAKARGTTSEALEKSEIDAKVAAPTDAEIQKVYDDNKAQLGAQTLEQIKPRIVEYLKQQKQEERRQAFLGELKGKYKTTTSLRPPVVQVGDGGRPAKGAANAPIVIIEFSDYQCPFCKRAEDSVTKVLQTYGDKVRLVFRDFPLPMHPEARPASEAAACANDQGKFWEYHAKLFANQGALKEDNLKAYAKELGLDQAKFDKCLADKPHKAMIDKDIADGGKVGVTGTPAFFINGRMLSGAQPFEKFKEVIDDELAAKGAGKS
jgi:protein-disulfide isomerase